MKSSQKGKNHKPLLLIQQPDLPFQTFSVQHVYRLSIREDTMRPDTEKSKKVWDKLENVSIEAKGEELQLEVAAYEDDRISNGQYEQPDFIHESNQNANNILQKKMDDLLENDKRKSQIVNTERRAGQASEANNYSAEKSMEEKNDTKAPAQNDQNSFQEVIESEQYSESGSQSELQQLTTLNISAKTASHIPSENEIPDQPELKSDSKQDPLIEHELQIKSDAVSFNLAEEDFHTIAEHQTESEPAADSKRETNTVPGSPAESKLEPGPEIDSEPESQQASAPSSNSDLTLDITEQSESAPSANQQTLIKEDEVEQKPEDFHEEADNKKEDTDPRLKDLIRRLALYPSVLQKPFCEAKIDGKKLVFQVISKRGDYVRIRQKNQIETFPIRDLTDFKVLKNTNFR